MRDPNTPAGGRPAARPRLIRRAAVAASVVTALGVLAAPALVPSASTAGALDFPYVNQFSSAEGGSLSGDAAIVDGRLRLTDQRVDQAGAWSTDDTFPSDVGLEVEFTYAMYNTIDDIGADGLLLFLADGSAPQGVGAFGAALGYSCRVEATQGHGAPCDLPGVPGGVAAVALDRYGNFSLPLNQSGPGNRTDSVVIRGSGDGLSGYRYVDGVRAPGGTMTEGRTPRTVRVTLLPGDAGELSMTVRLETDGVMRTVFDQVPLHADGQTPLPSTLRLGFAGSTGKTVNVHEVDALRVWKPADLSVEHDLAATVQAGTAAEYTVTTRNVGPNASDPSALAVDVPDELHDVTWTCTAEDGTACDTPSGTGDVAAQVALPRWAAATVTIAGTVAADAAGPLESVATITPEPALGDSNETDNTSRASATVDLVADPEAHVETDKSVSPSTDVEPGDEIEYTLTARNRGPGVAQDVGAVDDLPSVMRFAGSDDGCTADGQLVTCSSGTALAAGESTTFRIRAVLDPDYRGDGSDVVNVATATSTTDPDGGDPSPGVDLGVVVPDDGGPDDGGPGDGGPGDGGDGDGGDGDDVGDDGGIGVVDTDGAATDRGPGRAGRLASTGAEDVGLLAGISGVAIAAGGTCWWLARRRARRSGAMTDD